MTPFEKGFIKRAASYGLNIEQVYGLMKKAQNPFSQIGESILNNASKDPFEFSEAAE